MEFILSLFLNCVGGVFKSVINIFKSFTVKVDLIECRLDRIKVPDGAGGFLGGSRVEFIIEIINRKDKKFIINEMCCVAMQKGKILQDNICCYNKDKCRKIALSSIYEPLSTINRRKSDSVHSRMVLTALSMVDILL